MENAGKERSSSQYSPTMNVVSDLGQDTVDTPHTENGVPAVAVVVTLVLNESKCLESKGKWKDSLRNGKISHFGSA